MLVKQLDLQQHVKVTTKQGRAGLAAWCVCGGGGGREIALGSPPARPRALTKGVWGSVCVKKTSPTRVQGPFTSSQHGRGVLVCPGVTLSRKKRWKTKAKALAGSLAAADMHASK